MLLDNPELRSKVRQHMQNELKDPLSDYLEPLDLAADACSIFHLFGQELDFFGEVKAEKNQLDIPAWVLELAEELLGQ